MRTKFGNIRIHDGYYYISSAKEGNHGKSLHRLIWEDHYKKKVPKGYVIHHINKNKLDNRIQNLQCVEKAKHHSYHNIGRTFSKETLQKMSKSASEYRNKTGYFRVYKEIDDRCKQGFIWRYCYQEGVKIKRVSSVNIEKLKEKVLSMGLEWRVLLPDHKKEWS